MNMIETDSEGAHRDERNGASREEHPRWNVDSLLNEYSFLQPTDRPGSLGRLAHFEIQQVLGQGGFGVVFHAVDTKLRRAVAIKVIAPALAATASARQRFLREARATAAVRHQNVVQTYSVHEDPWPYLVMELIDGETLQQRSDAMGPMPLEDLLCIGQQVASGLSAAHKNGLLHRDIKPDNILLENSSDIKVKIADFGLATMADDTRITRTGSISGTPMYMSPEQALEQAVDHRSDLFSLGSVLYLMATGRAPFRATTTLAVLHCIAEETPQPIGELAPATPAWLCAIIAKLQAKSPERRFQSAAEVSRLLADCHEQLRVNGQVTAADQLLEEHQTETRLHTSPRLNMASQNHVFRLIGISGLLVTTVLLGTWALVPSIVQDITSYFSREVPASNLAAQQPPAQSLASTGAEPPTILPAPAIAPFDAKSAEGFQLAWSRYLGRPLEFENSLGIRFRLIPPGSFMMGSTQEEVDSELLEPADDSWKEAINSEAPKHLVELTRPFYMSVNEITQQEYVWVLKENPSIFAFGTKSENGKIDYVSTQPVENVTWVDAIRFCNQMSYLESRELHYKINGNDPIVVHKGSYRLPTEAEWEFACRAGTTTRFWTGDAEESIAQAGCIAGKDTPCPQPVGLSAANPFGLHDTVSNVLEWVEDSWEPDYYARFSNSPAVDPHNLNLKTFLRVAKGGSFKMSPRRCRSAMRRHNGRTVKNERIGFRIVLVIEDERLSSKAVPQ